MHTNRENILQKSHKPMEDKEVAVPCFLDTKRGWQIQLEQIDKGRTARHLQFIIKTEAEMAVYLEVILGRIPIETMRKRGRNGKHHSIPTQYTQL